MSKIGIGVITAEREDLFTNCCNSLPDADYTVVIHNGTPYIYEFPQHIDFKTYNEVQCVAINKNRALRAMIQNGCEHLFLIEDDIVISNRDICKQYINAASQSGIWHLNYCVSELINTMEYSDTALVNFFSELNSKFSYYHRNIIKHVGYFDERFRSGLSGPEHTYTVAKKRLCPPYGAFASVECGDSIQDQDYDKERSIIDYKTDTGIKKIQDDTYLFLMKNNETLQDVKSPDQAQLESSLQTLKDSYSREVL